MAFNINDLKQYFDNPAVSKFDRKVKKGFTCQLGKMIPANWEILGFGNSMKGSSFHSLRLAPMLAPNFSDLQVQEHVAAVPLRVIMDNFEDTFNYALNKEGSILPSFSATEYHDILKTMCNNGLNPIGSLLDFLGYPVYADLFDSLSSAMVSIDGDSFDIYGLRSFDDYLDYFNNEPTYYFTFTYRNTDFEINFGMSEDCPAFDLLSYAAVRKYPLSTTKEAIRLFMNDIDSVDPNYHISTASIRDIPLLDYVVEASTFETIISLMNSFNSYLFGKMLSAYLSDTNIPNDSPRYSTLPLRAYWRFHYDWNTNGNFTDRDVQLRRHVFNLDDELRRNIGQISTLVESTYKHLLFPADRLWRNDMFTSQLPSSAVDNAIEIPANSTVLNLASLTAFQKLVLKLSYSSRFRDVIWNVFKIMPSDARLQQSSVIDRRYHSVGIGETLQTSQTTTSSVLGNFAGRGYSAGSSKGFHIFAEEPMIVINTFSLIPFASYADALHPNIHLDDIFDLPIPDMDVLGNQPIYSDLISGNVTDSNKVFGFGRQYQEFLTNVDRVHGSFKTSLNYWQLTRRFDSTPMLNEEFLRMSSREDFDTIFSVPQSDHAFVSIVYNNSVTRHVHRNVRILV